MELTLEFGKKKSEITAKDSQVIVGLESNIQGKQNRWNLMKNITPDIHTKKIVEFSNSNIQGGFYILPFEDIKETTYQLYKHILDKNKNHQLCRAWNFIPKINEEINNTEIYKIFNKGRSKAFEETNKGNLTHMPAATGIDILGKEIVIGYIASNKEVKHFSNPLQTDPYNYPKKYGIKSPSFSRASTAFVNGKRTTFVSGTASIRGSQTVFENNLEKQIDTLIENIQIMERETETPENPTQTIIYVRNEDNLQKTKKYLEKNHPKYAQGIYLQANICRKNLDVEISSTYKARK